MKSLKSIFALVLIASSSLFASSDYKVVKSEIINGKPVPVIILKAIEVSAIKKEFKVNGNIIADETFASSKKNLVKSEIIKGKIVPVVSLKTVEVFASRKVESNSNAQINTSITKANLVKTTLINGELMPVVELQTADVIAERKEQKVAKTGILKISNLLLAVMNLVVFK